ncbi:MAG: DNA adenine methylase [Desulfarculales bacterium]|nr:DNA adenine methylase [Desulfarculales bacterium]
MTSYCELFVGGGALLFQLQQKTAFVNDINIALIGVYRVIKSDVEALITALQRSQMKPMCFILSGIGI